jgi:hypothetical protein
VGERVSAKPPRATPDQKQSNVGTAVPPTGRELRDGIFYGHILRGGRMFSVARIERA